MKLAIGSDHAGYEFKKAIIEKMKAEGHEIIDVGTDSPESTDYPKYGHAVGKLVAAGDAERGIAVCGTGVGISISCNKIPGIRAALCTSVEMAELCSRHNNANVLCLGARIISQELAFDIIDKWMTTEFEGGRHLRRVNEIEDLDF
ncbi:MAG: ribose 5-phosphate isomerase B [Mogibacterium sp.]|nr:ribose 5-phosphate isomerase B [Mogibacterium sp.]